MNSAEAILGKQMREQAHAEGHRPSLPDNSDQYEIGNEGRLIERFHKVRKVMPKGQPMNRDEIADLLGLSPSGAAKWLVQINESFGCIKIDSPDGNKKIYIWIGCEDA